MSLQEVLVPDIGDYSDVDVIEILVNVGDSVGEEDPLIALETDKATMEIPAPNAGVVKELLVDVGSKVSQGSPIVKLAAEGVAAPEPKKEEAPKPAAEKPTEAPAKAEPAPQPAAPTPAPAAEEPSDAHASPAVRRIIRELGLSLTDLAGTGRKGRITKEDVQDHIRRLQQGGGGGGFAVQADPIVDFAKFGPVEEQPLSRIKKISGAALQRNWIKIPHVTFYEDADITDLEAFRKDMKAQHNVKLTPLAFIIKAAAHLLTKFPNMNASLSPDGSTLVHKQYVHVGFAVDTPNGLVVPVIRDADKKGVLDIAHEVVDLSLKARDGKLTAQEMQGGCFTISSIGNLGTRGFTPIINMPEVGILGVSKAAMGPVYDPASGSFVPRLQLPLSLSVDHRVIDGAEGATFVATMAKCLSDFRQISM